MRIIDPKNFSGAQSWDALDIANIDGATVRLHWTRDPYIWHVNDGEEVFVVLDGEVDMHCRDEAGEKIHRLRTGDIFHASTGDEHVAHPQGEARILVIEQAGSI
ncbi:MAG: cupin [Rhodospirillaceae bacterium]|nr:MAG: cupin [Rhodospirillaceae bacterium]